MGLNRTLMKLNLSWNGLGEVGLVTLMDAASKNGGWGGEEVDLSFNGIDSRRGLLVKGVVVFFSEMNGTIKQIDLSNNKISKVVEAQILKKVGQEGKDVLKINRLKTEETDVMLEERIKGQTVRDFLQKCIDDTAVPEEDEGGGEEKGKERRGRRRSSEGGGIF